MGVAGDVAAHPKTADEVSRIEKLGMIVTVVSAKSRSEMERYLQTQGINPTTVDLSSLDGYFGEEGYAFVSGWVAKRSEPVQATGLKIIFPSPTIWFPLKPTRVYTDPVETVVYVRGFVKPADGCDLPNLKCEYVYADIKKKGVQETFRRDDPLDPAHYYDSPPEEEFTRITLTTDTQQWDRDLELVPGTNATGTLTLMIHWEELHLSCTGLLCSCRCDTWITASPIHDPKGRSAADRPVVRHADRCGDCRNDLGNCIGVRVLASLAISSANLPAAELLRHHTFIRSVPFLGYLWHLLRADELDQYLRISESLGNWPIIARIQISM